MPKIFRWKEEGEQDENLEGRRTDATKMDTEEPLDVTFGARTEENVES